MRCENIPFSKAVGQLEAQARGSLAAGGSGGFDDAQVGVIMRDGQPAQVTLFFQDRAKSSRDTSDLADYLKVGIDLTADTVETRRETWGGHAGEQPKSSLGLAPPRALTPRERNFFASAVHACAQREPGSDTEEIELSQMVRASKALRRE